jgi:putative sterol carrier protein
LILAQKTVQGLALTDSIEVDLYIEMSSQNFIDFLQGTLPIQDAMEQRTLHLDGNMSLMVEMSKALRMLP